MTSMPATAERVEAMTNFRVECWPAAVSVAAAVVAAMFEAAEETVDN